MEIVRAVMSAPGLREEIMNKEDYEDFQPQNTDDTHWLLLWGDAELLGVYRLHYLTEVCFIIHANVLPDHWGKDYTDEISQKVLQWVRTNTEATAIIAFIPDDCEHVIAHTERAGFDTGCIMADAIRKDGITKNLRIMARKI